MKYYSTNGKAPIADLQKAVVKGLAEDRGLYMPERIKQLPEEFFDTIETKSFQEIAYTVADAFFGEDVEADALKKIVYDTLSFDCPVVKVKDNNTSMTSKSSLVNVLVATSGDTGSAVANGFLGVDGIHVYVLYPKGKVSKIQESQFTTLGKNITAVEVDGVFDDCQALVKNAFMDEELNKHMKLTSANSINVARFLPQAFYYFNAYARMKALGKADNLMMCVPSGNFGNICSALFGHAMGLPIKRFIAANNANDIFYKYLQTGKYEPKPSVQTLANAMDVGDPSNFARIYDLYGKSHERISSLISGATYSDAQIEETMRQCYQETGYTLDPHGACGYRALQEGLKEGEVGVFCETAHPAKFKETVDRIIGGDVEIPERLAAFMRGQKQSVELSKNFEDFKRFLMSR